MVKICVTQKDINTGKKESMRACPIAKAVRRATKKTGIEVTGGSVWIKNDRYNLPTRARRFVSRFDGELPVKPFQFNLCGL